MRGEADSGPVLDYEKLDVYKVAIEHLAFVLDACGKLPKGNASIVDQWRRAATSIPLNIAEAVGKTSMPERLNRYAIARGEAMECGALLDVVRLVGAHDLELTAGRTFVVRLVEMLSKMCRASST